MQFIFNTKNEIIHKCQHIANPNDIGFNPLKQYLKFEPYKWKRKYD